MWKIVRRPLALLGGMLLLLLVVYDPSYHFQTIADVGLYQAYAMRALAVPRDLPREYPPLATGIFVLPRLLLPGFYVEGFMLLAALAGWLTLLLVDRLSGKGWLLLLFLSLGTWSTLFVRYDVVVALATVAAYWAARRRWWFSAQALLALAVGLKLYPLILMPLVVLEQWRAERRWPWRAAGSGLLTLLLVVGGSALLAPAQFQAMLDYHRSRPLEFESLGASLAWLIGPVRRVDSHGSLNMLSPYSTWLIDGLSLVGGGLLLGIYALFALRRLGPAQAWTLVLLVAIVTSKVFSTQYLLWVLPFVALCDGSLPEESPRAGWLPYRAMWTLICILTTLIFPIALMLTTQTTFMALATARNSLWLVATAATFDPALLGRMGRRLRNALDGELGQWRPTLAWSFALLLLVALSTLVSINLPAVGRARPDWGTADDAMVFGFDGFAEAEQDARGTTYRWSAGHSRLVIPVDATIALPLLKLSIGGLPPTVDQPRALRLEQHSGVSLSLPVTGSARSYQVILPASLGGELRLGLSSPTSRASPDPRPLGVRLDDITVEWPAELLVLPFWRLLLCQWGIVVVTSMLFRYVGVHRLVAFSLLVVLTLWLSLIAGRQLFLATAWERRWLLVSLLALFSLWSLMPRRPAPSTD